MSSRWFQPRAKICLAANRRRSGSRKRSKASIGTVRDPCLHLDIAREVRPTSLRASDTVPTPSAFLSTSFGKYQIFCRVHSSNFEQESTLKLLAIPFGGDLACTDCDRVLRMPGFRNSGYDQPYSVTVTYPYDSTSNPGNFRLETPAADAMLLPHAIPSRKHSDQHTNSEHDWAWILHELSRGEDAAKPTRTLASRRPDKPCPLYHYAQRRADVPSARLRRIEGVPMEDVVTLRVVRRRFGIASALRIRKGPRRARRRCLQGTLHLGWSPWFLCGC